MSEFTPTHENADDIAKHIHDALQDGDQRVYARFEGDWFTVEMIEPQPMRSFHGPEVTLEWCEQRNDVDSQGDRYGVPVSWLDVVQVEAL